MKLVTINYLRFYAILSLVLWHCFVCPLTVAWYIIDQTPATITIGKVAQFFIPNANMPLFVFIAGFVFAFAIEKGKYKEFLPFLWNKTKRLVIPFFTLGTLICLTAPQRYLDQIIWGGGSHLWFCIMLFWIFIIAWGANWTNTPLIQIILFISSVAYVLYNHCTPAYLHKLPLGLHNTFFYYCYFCMGEFVCRKRDNAKWLWGMLGAIVLIYIAARFGSSIGVKGVGRIYNFLQSPMLIMALYMLARFIPEQKYKSNGFVDTICVYGFGIYVFHEWIHGVHIIINRSTNSLRNRRYFLQLSLR